MKTKVFKSLAFLLMAMSVVACRKDEYRVDFDYVLYCSDGLLKFVTPVVTYLDENGQEQTITLSESDWNTSGKVSIENDGSSVSMVGLARNSWQKNIHFDRFNVSSEMTVKYVPKESVDYSETDVFAFMHTLGCSIKTDLTGDNEEIHNQSLAVDVSSADIVTGANVAAYIRNLADNPDKITVSVDGGGKISRK